MKRIVGWCHPVSCGDTSVPSASACTVQGQVGQQHKPAPHPTLKCHPNMCAEWDMLCVHFREMVDVTCVSFACASTSHSFSGSFLTSQDWFLSSGTLSFEFQPTPRAEESDYGSLLLLIIRGISYLDCWDPSPAFSSEVFQCYFHLHMLEWSLTLCLQVRALWEGWLLSSGISLLCPWCYRAVLFKHWSN